MEIFKKTEWQPLTLPGNKKHRIYIEATIQSGREEVGILDAIPFNKINEILSGIASSIGDTLEKSKPKKAAVELGLEFGVENGKLIALIAQGTGKANLKIRLEWENIS